MNRVLLWLVGLANPLWRKFGADPKALGLILATKLKMDDRGGYVMGQQQKPKSGMEYLIFFFMFLFGGFTIYFFVALDHDATATGLLFSFWMVYIGLLLITELSETLFDARDLYVLLSRPITDVTLSLSRILHIGVFTTKFALCFGVPVAIYLLFWQGIWPLLVFCVLAFITVVMTMTGTLVLYLIMLRRVRAQKLKKVIGYFQMVATGFFFILYQLPQLMDSMDSVGSLQLSGTWAGFLFPGFWLGGWWSVLVEGGATNLSWLQGILAVLAAGFGAWFYVNQSANYGEKLLELRMAGSAEEDHTPTSKATTDRRPWYRDWIAHRFTQMGIERASFRFTWKVMLRDMSFKQRTYPAMVFLPVLLGIIFFKEAFAESEDSFTLGAPQILIALYMTSIVIITPLGQAKISESYRASWIFMATPNAEPGAFAYGHLLAILGMFFVPTMVVVSGSVLIFGGLEFLPDIILAIGANLLFAFIYHSIDKNLPFSQDKQSGGFETFGPFIVVSLVATFIGFAHYGLRMLPYGVGVWAGAIICWTAIVLWSSAMRKKERAFQEPKLST